MISLAEETISCSHALGRPGRVASPLIRLAMRAPQARSCSPGFADGHRGGSFAAEVLDRLGYLGAHPVSRRPVSNLRAACPAQACWPAMGKL